VLDGDAQTAWSPARGDRDPWLELDFGAVRELGGFTIRWPRDVRPPDYVVELGNERADWKVRHEIRGSDGGRDDVYLPESEARWVRLRPLGTAPIPTRGDARTSNHELRVAEIQIRPIEWSATPDAFFSAIARESPRGNFPRTYLGESHAWAVVGLDGDDEEALLSEDGALEVGKSQFTVEPFLRVDGRLLTWNDVRTTQRLAEDRLPIPTVEWTADAIVLEVTALATGDTADARILVRYRLRNLGLGPRRATLYLGIRPFQVNPPWQSVGMAGGFAPIREIVRERNTTVQYSDGGPPDVFRIDVFRINGERYVMPLYHPSAFGATNPEGGDLVEHLRAGRIPPLERAKEERGFLSAVMAYELELPGEGAREVSLLVPLGPRSRLPLNTSGSSSQRQLETSNAWKAKVPRILDLPGAAAEIARTLEAQIGWILVNRDGGSIQPGSRSYDRSWIRDGSLTSSALLRVGVTEPVREFIEWFAPFQYDNGKIPCCAEPRGPDPVTENDSHGQFIYLIAEYHRYTGDRAIVERHWPRVVRAIGHMDSLRRERQGPAWRTPAQRRFYGLLLPSISHEGYPNPMHSYWDDFFGYLGYSDAAYLAGVLGRDAERARFTAARDEFGRDLAASVRATMAHHRIAYVPGCAELGDFDATSTTVAITPTSADGLLPPAAVRATFERYWKFFEDRRDGRLDWDAYTPYETRVIGSFVRLGQRERALAALDFFMAHRRPAGWRQWAEVVTRDPRAPRFFGDLPHTWVGSDFMRSVLDLFCYERDSDRALVLAAGVAPGWGWEGEGVGVRGLRTPYGAVSYRIRASTGSLEFVLDAERVPPGGFVLLPPGEWRSAEIDGKRAALARDGTVVVRSAKARVVFHR